MILNHSFNNEQIFWDNLKSKDIDDKIGTMVEYFSTILKNQITKV